MDNKRIAKELLMVAKELTADYGDEVHYFNLFDYFKKADGGNLDASELRELETYFSDFVGSMSRDLDKQFEVALKSKVKRDRRFSDWMNSNGVSLKV